MENKLKFKLKNNNKIYMAGPLFKESDRIQKIQEGRMLRDLGFDPFNPIENLVVGDGNVFTAKAVFDLDNQAIDEAAWFYFDLDNCDTGTFTEFGQCVEQIKQGKVDPNKVVIVAYDEGRAKTYGEDYYLTHIFNAYPGGAIQRLGIKVCHNFEGVLNYLRSKIQDK